MTSDIILMSLPEKSDLNLSKDDYLSAFRTLVSLIERYDEDTQFTFFSDFRGRLSQKGPFHNPLTFVVDKISFAPFINDGFFHIIDDPALVIASQRDLLKRLEAISFVYPSDLERTKAGNIRSSAKSAWCFAHPDLVAPLAYPDSVVVFPSALLRIGGELLLEYLCCKFCDTLLRMSGSEEIQFPSGAKVTSFSPPSFEYPNNAITDMLNYYGHNRCVVYTKPRKVFRRRGMSLQVELRM